MLDSGPDNNSVSTRLHFEVCAWYISSGAGVLHWFKTQGDRGKQILYIALLSYVIKNQSRKAQ